MTTPLLAIGLLSKISSATRQGLQQVSQANKAATGADEIANGQNVPGGKAKFDLQSLFKTLDGNQDGTLSKDELKKLAGALPPSKLSTALLSLQESSNGEEKDDVQAALFGALDKNSDGKIGSDEFGVLASGVRGLLRSIGAAGDGERGAASLGASGLKPASDIAGIDVDRDKVNRAAIAYSRTSAPAG